MNASLRRDLEDLQIAAKGLADDVLTAPDNIARDGLRERIAGDATAWSRHVAYDPSVIHCDPTPTAGRCRCHYRGDRCVLTADAEDLRCTPCRIACGDAV